MSQLYILEVDSPKEAGDLEYLQATLSYSFGSWFRRVDRLPEGTKVRLPNEVEWCPGDDGEGFDAIVNGRSLGFVCLNPRQFPPTKFLGKIGSTFIWNNDPEECKKAVERGIEELLKEEAEEAANSRAEARDEANPEEP